MWKRKIKNKKIQFILISIILMLASCILSVSVSFKDEVSKYVDTYYNGKNIKDIIFTSYDKNTTLKVENFIKEKEVLEKDIRKTKKIDLDKKLYLENKLLDLNMLSAVLYEGEKIHPWEILITEGKKTLCPKEGEVFVSNILADSKNFKIGDKLKIKNGDKYVVLKISNLVNDSVEPNSTMGITNIYIGKKDYDKLDYFEKYDVIGYNSSKEKNEAVKELNNYLGHPINGEILDKETILFSANESVNIIGGVGISTAILVFIVSIIIIRFILWNNILKEFRSIGIHKALGFTSRQISLIYIKSFGVIGILSILLGAILSLLFKSYLVQISLKYIGIPKGTITDITSIILVVLILSIILIINLFFMLKKLDRINPVEALRVGITSAKARFKKSFIKNAVSPISMAINDIFKYKKQNFIICIVLIFTMYLSVFMVGTNYSIANMKYNSWNVFGSVRGDMNISFSGDDKTYNNALEEIKKDTRIVGVRENGIETSDISINYNKYNIKSSIVFTTLHDNYKGLDIENGRNPENIKEIALTDKILEDSKLNIGDYVEIDILGEKKKMLITGSFKALISSGYNMRGLKDLLPNGKYTKNIILNLENKSSYDNIKKYYENKYKTCTINEVQSDIKTVSESIVDIVDPIVKILVTAAVAFSVINIINILVINNTDNRRNYAIMKSLGFSNRYILKRSLWRILILSILAITISFMLNIVVSPILFKSILMGINAYILSTYEALKTLLGMLFLIGIGTILVMRSVKKVSIIELLED